MIIDATNLILGRLASHAAKLALQGESVIIVNSEKAIISGKKKLVEGHYLHKLDRGEARKGPFFPRRPDMILRRTIRGMLPMHIERGRKAYKRVMCHIGVPNQYAEQKLDTIKDTSADKLNTGNYLEIGKLSKRMGYEK